MVCRCCKPPTPASLRSKKLVDSAKSIANQVLQSPTGYSAKSSVTSTAITGATASNLLGTAYTNSTVTGSTVNNDNTSGALPITAATKQAGRRCRSRFR